MALSPTIIDAVKESLLAGSYNLLIGAGVSSDSKDKWGNPLPLGDSLRRKIIGLKNIRENSSLARAYSALTSEEVKLYISDAFTECKSGPTAQKLTEFVWKRVYTLNVDDSLEDAYAKSGSRQHCTPLTHKDTYRNPEAPNALQIVHVHGLASKPDDGYVFSLAEYAGGMGPGNPWVSILGQTLSSEPFIIAGTSLEEPDLEYFIRGRTPETARRDRGPSFLVEPQPDPATVHECERHGVILYEGTLLEFLLELDVAIPVRPLPLGVNLALRSEMFSIPVTQRDLALFSRDFWYLTARRIPENSDLGFYVGRAPNFDDIALERDVARSVTATLRSSIRSQQTNSGSHAKFLLYFDDAGTGKTTICYRTLYDMAAQGVHIFVHTGVSSPDLALSIKLLSNFKEKFVLFGDDFADHAAIFREIYLRIHRNDFAIFGTERSYRRDHVSIILGTLPKSEINGTKLSATETRSLISKMDGYGLTTGDYSSGEIDTYARDLTSDCIAIAVCRVMNDFRPIERIVTSLITHADEARRERYVACAISFHCYRRGIPRNVLSSTFQARGLSEQFNIHDIMPLSYSDYGINDYVIPSNPILADRLLRELVRTDIDLVFETYCSLGAALAPYVDRAAIRRRTTEARLVGRLFDYDEVVQPLLGTLSESFYLRMKRHWDWNSRYWEQFALMKLDGYARSGPPKDPDLMVQAISHAKHAVKVERHPLPLTTLGTVLLEEMKSNMSRRDASYLEAYDVLQEAIRMEGDMRRIAIHPFNALINGTYSYAKLGGTLTLRQKDTLRRLVDEVQNVFPHERALLITIANLRPYIS